MKRLLLALTLLSASAQAENFFVNFTDADQARWADVDALMASCGPVTKVEDCAAVVSLLRDFAKIVKAAIPVPPAPVTRTPGR